VGEDVFRIDFDRFPETRDSLVQLLLKTEGAAEAVVVVGGFRVELDGLGEVGDGLVVPAKVAVYSVRLILAG
jgi:hypothetical protein